MEAWIPFGEFINTATSLACAQTTHIGIIHDLYVEILIKNKNKCCYFKTSVALQRITTIRQT